MMLTAYQFWAVDAALPVHDSNIFDLIAGNETVERHQHELLQLALFTHTAKVGQDFVDQDHTRIYLLHLVMHMLQCWYIKYSIFT